MFMLLRWRVKGFSLSQPDTTDDVKEVAKQMEKEEVVAQEEEQHYHRGR